MFMIVVQIAATGLAKAPNGDFSVSPKGVTVSAGGLIVNTGAVALGGDSHIVGSLSATTASATQPVLDVYASGLGASGCSIFGRINPSATTANALSLFEGSNVWFQVVISV